MKSERNTYYYPGAGQMPGMPGMGQMPGMPGMGQMPGMPGMGQMPGMPGFGMNQNTDQLEQRLSKLESQVRRLDIRLSRLETPYPEQTPYSTGGQYEGTGYPETTTQFPQNTQSIQGL